jgi:hypothetical protein
MVKIKNFIIGSYLFTLFLISVGLHKIESFNKKRKRKSFITKDLKHKIDRSF